jgi:hypothetical protein
LNKIGKIEMISGMKSHTWNFSSAYLYMPYSDPSQIRLFKKIYPLQSLWW